jgi:hypothetical protein
MTQNEASMPPADSSSKGASSMRLRVAGITLLLAVITHVTLWIHVSGAEPERRPLGSVGRMRLLVLTLS